MAECGDTLLQPSTPRTIVTHRGCHAVQAGIFSFLDVSRCAQNITTSGNMRWLTLPVPVAFDRPRFTAMGILDTAARADAVAHSRSPTVVVYAIATCLQFRSCDNDRDLSLFWSAESLPPFLIIHFMTLLSYFIRFCHSFLSWKICREVE